MISIYLADETATLNFGIQLALHAPTQCIIFLKGGLGAGKTTLVRGLLRELGYQGNVKSPTYTLVEPYHLGERTIYHFDLYRLRDPNELEHIGIRDYFSEAALCLIEWPERADKLLPKADLTCYIHPEEKGRVIEIAADTELGQTIINNLDRKRG